MAMIKKAWDSHDAPIIKMSPPDGKPNTTTGRTVFLEGKNGYGLLITHIETTKGCFDVIPVLVKKDGEGNTILVRDSKNHPTFKGGVRVGSWNTGRNMFVSKNVSDVEMSDGDPAIVTFIAPD